MTPEAIWQEKSWGTGLRERPRKRRALKCSGGVTIQKWQKKRAQSRDPAERTRSRRTCLRKTRERDRRTAPRLRCPYDPMAGGPSFQSLAVLQANQAAPPLPNSTPHPSSATSAVPAAQPASSGPIKKRRKRGEADGKRYPCDQCEKCTFSLFDRGAPSPDQKSDSRGLHPCGTRS